MINTGSVITLTQATQAMQANLEKFTRWVERNLKLQSKIVPEPNAASGVELHSIMEERSFTPLPELEAKLIFRVVAKSLAQIHDQNKFHGNISLENIRIGERDQVSFVGTLHSRSDRKKSDTSIGYTSPELRSQRKVDALKVDVWSLGIVLYGILFGFFPTTTSRLSMEIQFPNVPFSEEVKGLLRKMLNPSPSKRCSMKKVLRNSWLAI
eukprot:TRINITY_DN8846_c0_g1_i1.p1 TRINITY_DN8846_c0_g1~~TRINITY_DN8846_c0_g1_i1.p1  ORF type:complete len:210 (+),score=29.36 TRINITY_DN8846_c0_g1_i1:105-734(+)